MMLIIPDSALKKLQGIFTPEELHLFGVQCSDPNCFICERRIQAWVEARQRDAVTMQEIVDLFRQE